MNVKDSKNNIVVSGSGGEKPGDRYSHNWTIPNQKMEIAREVSLLRLVFFFSVFSLISILPRKLGLTLRYFKVKYDTQEIGFNSASLPVSPLIPKVSKTMEEFREPLFLL
jgi:hypothetical protein